MTDPRHARAIAAQEEDVSRRLMAAAVTEFASMLKQRGFPQAVKMESEGRIKFGVPLPRISWTTFEGSREDAIEQIQTHGLPSECACDFVPPRFLDEAWTEVRLSD